MTQALALWAQGLCAGFASAGVRNVVISPGSRSTPIVIAALAHPQLRCCSIADERSAGFFALGQAKATGSPSVLLCTSGSAGSHYLPAVIEASEDRVPLVVVTADRPPERADCGAPQVTDQIKLYGSHVRAFWDLGPPDDSERALRAVSGRAAMAVSRSCWPVPGPVHLNFRARKPLEPTAHEEAAGRGAVASARVEVVRSTGSLRKDQLARLAEKCAQARRPLVVAGPAPLYREGGAEAVVGLLQSWRAPIFAEVTSQLRLELGRLEQDRGDGSLLDAGAALVGSPAFRRLFQPDLVLQLGRAPIAAGWEEWIESSGCFHVVVSEAGWNDPVHTADLMVLGAPDDCCSRLAELLPPGASKLDPRWLEGLAKANQQARRIAGELAEGGGLGDLGEGLGNLGEGLGDLGGGLGEAQVARIVGSLVPERALLGVGNSLPIRWLELFAGDRLKPAAVWCQRGANGIDGLVSGFAGSVHGLVGETRPPSAALLLIGDVSLLHDLGGLGVLRLVEDGPPLVIVVVNNRGGRIFDLLPLADLGLTEREIEHWTTPPAVDLSGLAQAFGIRHARASRAADLESALREALAGGRWLIEAEVAPDSARRERDALRRELERSLVALEAEAG